MTDFTATRNAMHHAAQVASAWGATHLDADPDHQYANLGWDPALRALIGRQADESITADEIAARLGTIPYEVVTAIAHRVPRIPVQGP